LGDGDDFKPGANPRLTLERRARLEAIGFEWKVKHKMKRYYDRQWDTMFEKMLQYKAVSTARREALEYEFVTSISYLLFSGERSLSHPQAVPSLMSSSGLGFTRNAFNFEN
jgi:hypothetical protein